MPSKKDKLVIYQPVKYRATQGQLWRSVGQFKNGGDLHMEGQEIYIRLYKSMITSGLMSAMSDRAFKTLIALALHMDEKGECYPTQDQLAKWLGVTRETANLRVKELLDFRFNDKPVVVKVKNRRGGRNNVYRIEPISQLAIFNSEVESVAAVQGDVLKPSQHEITDVSKTSHEMLGNPHITMLGNPHTNKNHINDNQVSKINNNTSSSAGMAVGEQTVKELNTPKGVITYFCEKYQEKYGCAYSVAWQRDSGLVKNKLLGTYTPAQIKDIIDVTLSEYDQRWANDKYPRPTIGALVTWIPNKALAVTAEKEKAEVQRQADARAWEAAEYYQSDEYMNKVMARLSRVADPREPSGLKRQDDSAQAS